MESFDDDSRKRLVSMARSRSSTTNHSRSKEEFTKSVREEREKRSLEKKREKSCTLIQKSFRSHHVRSQVRRQQTVDLKRKLHDFAKLDSILGSRKERFMNEGSVARLVRSYLFINEPNDTELTRGILRVARRREIPQDKTCVATSSQIYREASFVSLLLRSDLVTADEVMWLVRDLAFSESMEGSIVLDTVARACRDPSFVQIALQCLRKAYKLGKKGDVLMAFVIACVIPNKPSDRQNMMKSLFLGNEEGPIRDVIHEEFLITAGITTGPMKQVPQLYRKQTYVTEPLFHYDVRILEGFVYLLSAEEHSPQTVGDLHGGLVCLEMLLARNLELKDESTIRAIRSFSRSSNVSALWSLCIDDRDGSNRKTLTMVMARILFCMINIDSNRAQNGPFGTRESILQGSLAPFEHAPVLTLWKVLFESMESDSSSPRYIEVVSFASIATDLLLDSFDDEELFLSEDSLNTNARLTPEIIEDIVLVVKKILYDSIWKQCANSDERILDFFGKLYERCSRHPSLFASKSMWYFSSVPPKELGLGDVSHSRMQLIGSAANREGATGVEGNNAEDPYNREDDSELSLLTSASLRGQSILRSCPMVIPFEQRVQLFHRHLAQLKQDEDRPVFNEETMQFEIHPRAQAKLNRSRVVQDAFEQLYHADLTGKTKITFVSDLGLEEAGVGPGPFKEFLTLFSQEAFDPKLGLFRENPQSHQLFPTCGRNFKLLEFVGTIIAKAVYDGILIEPEIAPFVMNIVRGNKNGVHDLQSLDQELYRNLMRLKTMSEAEIEAMDLSFSIFSENYNMDIELLTNGADVKVTKDNRLLYIERVAAFRLNRELLPQIEAFAKGFQSLIDVNWVRLFSSNEFALLIGGGSAASKDIDIDDLRRHVSFQGGYHHSQPYIHDFWDVLQNEMSVQQRATFLKFVTSCSRPPLTGFGSLNPPITIYQVRNEEDRLPTASTCVNLLKLPKYPSKAVLREKLLLAIDSATGFELT